jgi:hypothetical protein
VAGGQGLPDWLKTAIMLTPGIGQIEETAATVAPAIKDIGKTSKAAPKKADTAKKEDTKLPSPQAAAESPFTQLAQALAQQYLQQVQGLASLTSGAETPGLESEAQGAAQADLKALTPGLPASLTQIPGTSAAVPLAGQVGAAQQAVGNAQAQGALGMANAISETGTANTLGLENAPWSQILNELASETAYRASSPSYGASAFGATTANTSPAIQQIFSNVGLPVPKPGQGTATAVPGVPTPTKAASTSSSAPTDSTNPGAP